MGGYGITSPRGIGRDIEPVQLVAPPILNNNTTRHLAQRPKTSCIQNMSPEKKAQASTRLASLQLPNQSTQTTDSACSITEQDSIFASLPVFVQEEGEHQ